MNNPHIVENFKFETYNPELLLLRKEFLNFLLLLGRDGEILRLRYYWGMTFPEISKYYGVSTVRINQIHKRGLKRLRHRVNKPIVETLLRIKAGQYRVVSVKDI